MFSPLPRTYVMLLKKTQKFPKILWVYLPETLTRPYSSSWVSKGFKGLVAYAKYNCKSYESEFSSRVQFLFTQGRVKVRCGVFVGMIYYVILYPYLLSFSSYNNVIFRIFTCCCSTIPAAAPTTSRCTATATQLSLITRAAPATHQLSHGQLLA